ncbi:Helitron helicase-like domain at N-terminus [Fragilaria crotonensis]|nr:Helitron helicase-like domain at N-terminus [Fragilaria crotonensis]
MSHPSKHSLSTKPAAIAARKSVPNRNLSQEEGGDPVAATQMAAITTRNREQKRQTRLERLQRSQEGDPVAVTQMATITTRNREQKRQTRLERLQRSQEGDPVAVTQMAAITTQHQENMRQTRLERLQRSQEGDPVAATQMAAITTQHQEHMRQTRLERLQRSQEGDPVAATQMAAITTQHQEHMRQTRQSCQCTNGAAYSSAPAPARHVLGPCTVECQGCSALHFPNESRSERGYFSSCCAKGKVSLLPLDPTPNVLMDLFHAHELFMPHIRAYNSALSFASIGANVDDALIDRSCGIYTFRIHGSMYHRLGSLLPEPGQHPAFAQLYFYDTNHEVDNRLHHLNTLDRNTLVLLQQMIQNQNRLYGLFKQALDEETLASNTDGNHDVELPGHNVAMHILDQPELDNRRYNAPSSSEVAVILPDEGSGNRDIRVLPCWSNSVNLRAPSRLFSTGICTPFSNRLPRGWHPGMMQTGPNATTPHLTRLTCLMHAAFRLFVRPAAQFSNHLHFAGKLFHQYIVDCYAQVEQGRLNFIRLNQPRLRAELYQGIADAVAGEDVTNTRQLGRRIILPSSHIGSARNMHQLCQDALAIVRRMGKPDLFITMTTNPQWPEVVENLLPGQTVNDRPDLVARVFHLKFTEMMIDLQKRQVLGRVVAAIYTIEFQKRGLPCTCTGHFGRE